MAKKIIIFLIFFAGIALAPGFSAASPQKRTESKAGKLTGDTARIDEFNRMAAAALATDLEKANDLSARALELARSISYQRGEFDALCNLGDYHYYSGAYAPAKQLYRQAAGLAVSGLSTEVAKTYERLSSTSFLEGKHDSAIYYARQALNRLKRNGKPDEIVKILQSMGIFFKQIRRYDSAALMYARALEITDNTVRSLEAQTPAYTERLNQKAALHQLLAGAWFEIGNNRLAISELQKAISIATITANKKLQPELFTDMATMLQKKGASDKALEYFLKALRIYETAGNQLGIAQTQTLIGNVYFGLEDFDNANRFYRTAAGIHTRQGNKAGVALLYTNLGDIYCKTGQYDSAWTYYFGSVEISKLLNNNVQLGINYLNMGVLASITGEDQKAGAYLSEALQTFQAANEPGQLAKANLELGRHILKYSDFRRAELYLRTAYQYATEVGDIMTEVPAAAELARFYEKTGDQAKALNYFKLHMTHRDSLNSIEREKQITRIQSAFDFEKQQNELTLEQEKRKNLEKSHKMNRLIVYLTLTGLLMAGGFTYLIRRKEKEKIQIEKERISQEAATVMAQQALTQAELRNQELEKLRLIEELKYKTANLTNLALIIAQKNDFITELKDSLREIKTLEGQEKQKCLTELSMKITQQGRLNKDLNRFREEIDAANRDFYNRLTRQCPDLTSHDKELAGLLRINLSSKEIASLHNVSVKAVEMSRYRLRKKFNLDNNDNLVTFLQNLT